MMDPGKACVDQNFRWQLLEVLIRNPFGPKRTCCYSICTALHVLVATVAEAFVPHFPGHGSHRFLWQGHDRHGGQPNFKCQGAPFKPWLL